MEFIRNRPWTSVILAFVVGAIFGLVVLGWGLFPVEWTNANPSALSPEYQAIYVRNVAELYSFDNNQQKVQVALGGWGGDVVACQLAATSTDPADQQRLIAVATITNGQGCAGVGAPPAEGAPAEGPSSWVPAVLLGLLLLALIGAILFVYNRRKSLMTEQPVARPAYTTAAPEAPATTVQPAGTVYEPVAVPIARFRTNYVRGHDTYDDSFSIENANGEFLGECGVGIAETLGSGLPKNVTALEVWLFDKNDIRTITKVVMSDHAYFDEAIRAKLAPKGEPVLARVNETIVLETAALIINAEITDMAYGMSGEMPERSYFETFTIELSAWAKESGGNPAATGRAGDVMNY